MNAQPLETIDTYHAELDATGKVEREGLSITHEPARLNDNRKPAPWVLDYGKSGGIFCHGVMVWERQDNALRSFAGEVRRRIERRLAPIREAEALAARLAAPVDQARIIELLESAANWIENTPDEMTGEVSTLAKELQAAAEVLKGQL